MNSERVNEIRESREDGYWGSPMDDYECLEAEQHVDYLLAENARLQVVVEAARELHKHYPLVWNQPIDGDEFCPICQEYGYDQPGNVFQHDKDCPIQRLANALATE